MPKITISKEAAERLRLVAKCGNQTRSEAILYFLPKEYAQYPPESAKGED